MNIRTLKEMDVANKCVLVRVDYNVPQDKEGKILDTRRIRASVPTISYLLEHNCKIILASHLGRPDGKVAEQFRLDEVAKALSGIIGRHVKKLHECIGSEVESAVQEMKERDIVMLENLRFHPEEETNDRNFAKSLASLAQVYVNDAFGAAHRAHASVAAITEFLPSCAGLLLEKEIKNLSVALNPQRPFVVVIGGAKISDKIDILTSFSKNADALIVGGAMANTFLKAKGKSLGNSKTEDSAIDIATDLMKKFSFVLLPVDLVCAEKPDKNAEVSIINIEKEDVPENLMALDIGKESLHLFKRVLSNARTVIWNGPMGFYEVEQFAKGTEEMARMISGLSATTIVAGGDTAAIVEKLDIDGLFTHVSTGGGASLEFLSGKALPALTAIEQCPCN